MPQDSQFLGAIATAQERRLASIDRYLDAQAPSAKKRKLDLPKKQPNVIDLLSSDDDEPVVSVSRRSSAAIKLERIVDYPSESLATTVAPEPENTRDTEAAIPHYQTTDWNSSPSGECLITKKELFPSSQDVPSLLRSPSAGRVVQGLGLSPPTPALDGTLKTEQIGQYSPAPGTAPSGLSSSPTLPPLSPEHGPKPMLTTPAEPTLCPEQAELVNLICSGKNVFYTGSAGCGKSTVLKAFTKRLRDMGKDVRILAPTGRAALQVGGSTTWTYAGWTPDHHKRTLDELRAAAHGKFVWKRFRSTDVLVIDEISMVENLHFERLNAVMKEARYNPNLPVQPAFGGVQVIVTGDFCQLPPVKPFQHCLDCGKELLESYDNDGAVYTCPAHGDYHDKDKWAFKSMAWDDCNFAHFSLNTIHRQNDKTFIRMLQKCRIGERLTSSETNLLMNHPCQVNHATKLFATREEVNRVNRQAFDRLTGLKHTYWTRDSFRWQQDKHPHLQWKNVRRPRGPESQRPLVALEDHRFDECAELKKGMLVVLLVNLDLQMGLCNGSQGIICGFEAYDATRLPRAKRSDKDEPENRIFGDRAAMKEAEIKEFIRGEGAAFKCWPIVRFHNGMLRTIFADCAIAELGDEKPYSLLSRTQIPLAPAWAMTIHKSQSLTLDRVIVNLSKAFEEGQVYVALSRATCLEGLKIEGDVAGLLAGLGGNEEVQRFLRERFGARNNFFLE